MATIRVREIPESIYEALRRRGRSSGQSLQVYMQDQILEMAARPTKEASLVAIDTVLSEALGGQRPSLRTLFVT
jgi:hypothetical protein